MQTILNTHEGGITANAPKGTPGAPVGISLGDGKTTDRPPAGRKK